MTTKVKIVYLFLILFAGILTAGSKDSLALEKYRVKNAGGFYLQFSGTVGKSIPIDFDLTYRKNNPGDTTIFGYYYYAKNGQAVYLDGAFRQDSSITLYEYNDTGAVKAEFNGTLVRGTIFTGTYKNRNLKQEFSFSTAVNPRGLILKPATYRAVNCARADSIKKLPYAQRKDEDTSCSEITISWMFINSGGKTMVSAIADTLFRTMLGFGNDKSVSSVFDMSDLGTDNKKEEDRWLSVLYNERQIFSGLCGISAYELWSAHPGSFFTIRNFDLATGKEITIEDIIQPDKMNEFLKRAEFYFVRTNGGLDDWMFEDGNFKLSENFAFVRGGIVLRYNTYEAGSYAQGAPEVFIPLQEIKPYANPGSILDRLGF